MADQFSPKGDPRGQDNKARIDFAQNFRGGSGLREAGRRTGGRLGAQAGQRAGEATGQVAGMAAGGAAGATAGTFIGGVRGAISGLPAAGIGAIPGAIAGAGEGAAEYGAQGARVGGKIGRTGGGMAGRFAGRKLGERAGGAVADLPGRAAGSLRSPQDRRQTPPEEKDPLYLDSARMVFKGAKVVGKTAVQATTTLASIIASPFMIVLLPLGVLMLVFVGLSLYLTVFL